MSAAPFMLLLLGTLAAGLFTGGCQPHQVNLAPEPLVPGPRHYSRPAADAAAVDQPWWTVFADAKLNALIRQALTSNFDVLQARARLDQAARLSDQARAARLPQIDLTASGAQEVKDDDDDDRFIRLGAAFSWEIDVFNRLGALTLALRSQQAARREDVDGIRLSLSAAVAETYFDAVEHRTQLALLGEQIDTDRNLLELTELRFASGLTASVDVWQQSSQLAETESLVPPTEAALRVSENRLDLLLGEAPDAADRVTDADKFSAIGSLPVLGVPSDLLLRRPDLRALRSELIAADADIGRAIADRLPRIVLDGSLVYESGVDYDGPLAVLLGTLVQPLLDWGARKAEVERNRAVYIERLATFSQAYLGAIEDVENTLYLERKQREFLERLKRRRGFLERTVEETTDRYTNGLTDFLPVLSATKDLQQIERILVRQQRQLLGYRVRLHRALGGAVDPS